MPQPAETPSTSVPKPGTDGAGAGGAGRLADLRLRLLSGVVLAAVVLLALVAGAIPFAAVVLVVAVIMSWEWGRIVRGDEADLPLVIHGLAVALATGLAAMNLAALGLVTLGIGATLLFAVTLGGRPILSSVGVLYTGLPALALIWIRGDDPAGLPAVLYLALAVAATDTFAFLAGRLIGGPKLLPAISPKKTWSGLIGGVIAAATAGGVFAWIVGSPVMLLAIGGVLIALISQAGDMAESSLKRAFGVKDSSNLIPGHGGFMDRMDGVSAAAIGAGLVALFANPAAPAHALLYWN